MARKRIEGTTLQSWDDVDVCLKEIGAANREITLLETAQNEAIDKIRSYTKETAQPFQDKKSGLELAIKEYCEANRAEFVKVKTKELTFGSVGFRSATSIAIKRVAETLQALKDYGYNLCIRIKEEPDKESMKALTDEQLAEVGAARKTTNAFGYDVRLEELREAA